MRTTAFSFLTILMTLALASPLYANSQWSSQAPGTTFYTNPMLDHGNTDSISAETKKQYETGVTGEQSTGNLVGLPVIGQNGDKIGQIDDMKVDTRTGRIDYVVIDRQEGVDKHNYIPVPLGALQFNNDSARLVVDESTLNDVPSPTSMSARDYRQNLNAHYGIAPTWEVQKKTTIHQERKVTRP